MPDLPNDTVIFQSQDDNTWMPTVLEYRQMNKLEAVDLKPDRLIILLVEIKPLNIIVFCNFSNLDILYDGTS